MSKAQLINSAFLEACNFSEAKSDEFGGISVDFARETEANQAFMNYNSEDSESKDSKSKESESENSKSTYSKAKTCKIKIAKTKTPKKKTSQQAGLREQRL